MLRSVKELVGYSLSATDGSIGKVKDFLFDDAQWTLRWLVADTGDWLPKRQVLISPVSLGEPHWNSQEFPVKMMKADIERAPGLKTDEPVSREYETAFFDQYGWEYYWGGAGPWGSLGVPGVWGGAVSPVALFTRHEMAVKPSGSPDSPESRAHVLRSAKEVMGYHIRALDDEIGHVEDFVFDDESWTLRYLIVDTRNWLPGRKVLIATDWITDIEWADRQVSIGLSRDAVKGSPEYKPTALVNREYETNLYDYYGRPVYWQR